ncbi:TIGR03756 family integrating conjugative element protein [Salinicola sp. RZ23]|uniref:TIGR03756 family integrating conjugative element protein n=1 Tax=Salinicola sp. RZ23 TaxID=1949087 RepID=UPI000DA18E93|nr:TIGR03756 family integrating conjugative element protein [Salinicola sp. RZ23]
MSRGLKAFAVGVALALFVGLASLAQAPRAEAITTPEIMASSLSPSCLDYKVIGICAWLHCSFWGCTVRTSIRVKHYIPELVVSSYENTGDNPWREIALLSPPLGKALGGGSSHENIAPQHLNTHFKNVDAIGHPSKLFYEFAGGFGFMCHSKAVPFNPYFISTLDALAWRSGVPEMAYPEALVPGMREMGGAGDLWSPIYPRSGFVSQTHDYKVAATTAQRAADIVTRSGQPHVYQSLVAPQSPSRGIWGPDPVKEGERSTHRWQRLQPNRSMSCSIFPDGGQNAALQQPGDYVWALWRPYRCCKRRGQKLLYFTGG